METVDFTGEIRISSRIIDYLSSGLYNTPGACLKELVNNSFDADAQNVNVFVRPDADRIIIQDDDIGSLDNGRPIRRAGKTAAVPHFAMLRASDM